MKKLFAGALFLAATSLFGATYYAAPVAAGKADGSSRSDPMLVSGFLARCLPGDVLIMLAGTYTGSASMILPTRAGTAANPITIRAEVDGTVLIDGQWARIPIKGQGSNPHVSTDPDYYVIAGVNAARGSAEVVLLQRVNGWLVQRVCAWDAANGNTEIFAINYGINNTIEDSAGWGQARKIFISFSNGGPNTFRRVFGRMEKSTVYSPHITASFAYDSYQTLVENGIFTWDTSSNPASYTLLDYVGGQTTTCRTGSTQANGTCLMSGSSVDQPYGLLGADWFPNGNYNARATLLGNIAYVKPTARMNNKYLMLITGGIEGVTLKDNVAFYPSTAAFGPGYYTIGIYNGVTHKPNSLTNSTSFRGLGSGRVIGTDTTQTNVVEATSPATLYTLPGESLYNTAKGAQLKYRYVNGVLTSTPLWPWPMSARIKAATLASGYPVEDVDATIQGMFGTFPGGTPTATPTLTATTVPTSTPTATTTPTLTPTDTPTPTATALPTDTPTPIPTLVPTPIPTLSSGQRIDRLEGVVYPLGTPTPQ